MVDEHVPNRSSNSSGEPDEPEMVGPASGDEELEGTEINTEEAPEQPDEADLLAAVRRAAGWRVSPRQLAAAQAATAGLDEEPSPERLADLVDAMRGDRSQRQSRHAELWRALGAELAVREQPSDPAAQRAFIGESRARAGRWAGDALLLRIALEIAAPEAESNEMTEAPEPLEARQVAFVARRLRRRFGRQLDKLDIRSEEGPFVDALDEAIASMWERLNEPSEDAAYPTQPEPTRRGGTGGRHDRAGYRSRSGSGRFQGPRKRTHRRAKPAGVSRKPRKKKR